MKKRHTLGASFALLAFMVSVLCFAGCAKSDLPSTLATFDDDRVYQSGNIKYVVTKDEVDIVGINGSVGAEWVIPETVDSKTVTRLSFTYTDETLTSVTIPKSVYSIRGEGLFTDCTNLSSVTFASGCSITEIPTKAFSGTSLSTVTIPKTVKSIALSAFEDNSSLTKVTFESGSELKTIGPQAFQKCSNLQSIAIPSKVEKIAESAFNQCNNLTTVDFSAADSLTSIDQYAFSKCSKITSLTFPTNLLIIDGHAFANCDSLSEIKLNGSLKEIGDLAFYNTFNITNNSGIDEVIIPDSLSRLGEKAFAKSGVKKLTITSLVEDVSEFAFADCEITDIEIYGLTTLDSIFRNNTSAIKEQLVRAKVSNGSTSICDNLFNGCINLEEITIPASVSTIGEAAFAGCKKIDIFNLPASIKEISKNTFKDCSSLEEVKIGGETINDDTNITSIGSGAFSNCDSLQNIELPDALTVISSHLFDDCDNLSSVTLGSNLITIEAYAFNNCQELSFNELSIEIQTVGAYAFNKCVNIGLPSNHEITSIGDYAFASCNMLNKELVLDTNIKSIGKSAFDDVRGVEELTISTTFSLANIFGSTKDNMVSNLTKVTLVGDSPIGANEFRGANKLEELAIGEDIPAIGDNAFSGAIISTLTLPENGNLVLIGENAFENCNNLQEVIIPSSINSIGAKAFAECDRLEIIVLSDNVTLGETVFFNSNAVKRITTQGRYGLFSLFGESRLEVAKNITNITLLPNATNSGVIESYAYAGCEKLTTITIPNVVTVIGNYAFEGCSSLVTLDMVDGRLNSIGQGAFKNCSSLVAIDLGTTLTKIGEETFYQCISLVDDIVLPNSLTEIGKYAFAGCEKIDITIPESVEKIEEGAFFNCAKLSQVNALPTNVTKINPYIFYGCSKLTDFAIDISKIKEIGNYAFAECGNLVLEFVGDTSILNTIGTGAFMNCLSITIDEIPSTVEAIESEAFSNCSGINQLALPTTIAYIGDEAFLECDNLVTDFSLLTSVEYIGESAFAGCIKLTNADFSNLTFSSLEIGPTAFLQCYNISVINLSKAIRIGENAFAMIKEADSPAIYLTTTASNSYNSLFGVESNVRQFIVEVNIVNGTIKTIASSAFSDCINLETLTIADGIQIIGEYAFSNSIISNLVLPSTLIKIEKNAFDGCQELLSINIPASTKTLEDYAFSGCSKLASITFGEDSLITTLGEGVFAGTAITSFELPDGLTTISSKLFKDCIYLETITLPATINSFGEYAFEGCSALVVDTLPENENLTTVPKGLFKGCSSIGVFELPATITSIDEDAFDGCIGLSLVGNILPNGIETIGANAFKDCKALILTELPNTLHTLGAYAFSGCSSITIDSQASLINIGEYAFQNCTGITSFDFEALVINDTTVELGDNIFDGCTSIVSLTVLGEFSLGKLFGDTVESIKNTINSITILDASTSLASGMFEGFSELTSVDLAGTNISVINSNAFKGCSSLTSIIIPEKVIEIGDYAFAESGLTSIIIPSNVTTIGNGLFSKCKNLKEVEIINDGDGNGITKIGDDMFEETIISSIEIPESVESIGSNAFSGCINLASCDIYGNIDTISSGAFASTKLVSIILPSTVTSIENGAFANCIVLESIKTNDNSITNNLQGLTNLSKIGVSAFENCVALTSVDLPDSVNEIGDKAFANCKVLINVGITNANKLTYIGSETFANTLITSIVIPNTVGYIDVKAFSGAKALISVTFALESTLAEIKESAFENCSKLDSIIIPSTASIIGKQAFIGCLSLSDVEFSEGNEIDIVREATFKDCKSLRSINLPNAVYCIEKEAFMGCEDLMNINSGSGAILPTELIDLGISAFEGNARLKDLVIPSKITVITERAFAECNSLQTVDFANVREIGKAAFINANFKATDAVSSALKLTDTVAIIGELAFSGAFSDNSQVHIGTSNSENAVNISLGDGSFSNSKGIMSIVIGPKVNNIGKEAFKDCKKVGDINLTNSIIKTISEGMFTGCGELKEDAPISFTISLPSTLETIEKNAFNGANLQPVTLNDNLNEICENAFANSGLSTIVIPDTVEVIGINAFSGCTSLVQAEWGAGVKVINEGVFNGCSSLVSFTILGSVTYVAKGAFSNGGRDTILTITFEASAEGNQTPIATSPKFISLQKEDEIENLNILVPTAYLAAYQEYLPIYAGVISGY